MMVGGATYRIIKHCGNDRAARGSKPGQAPHCTTSKHRGNPLQNFIQRILLSAILLLPAAASAQTHEYMLDNGLKLLVREDHRAPEVVSQVWYKVGGSYEIDGSTGVSHALEHMMFKGTPTHPAGEFSRIIAENGGEENAFTGADYTAYFQTLEKSRLEIALELEADRMRNLSLPADEFAKEIQVVKEERRWRTDDEPEAFTYETAMATAFQTSPYRQPVIGWMADLNHMTVDDVKRWYTRWYAPNNAVLIVAGDVDPDAVHKLVQKYFGKLPRGEAVTVEPRPEVPQLGLKRVVVKRPAEVPYLAMIYKTPVLTTALEDKNVEEWEPYALEVLTGILDGGASARFSSHLVRGKEIAAMVNTDYRLASRLDSVLAIEATPSAGRTVGELESAIRAEIEDLKNKPVDPSELARVKAQVVSSDVYQRDSLFYQALLAGVLETVGLSWHVADEYVDKVKAITAEQVQAVAKKYLVDDRLTVAALDPQPMDKQHRPHGPMPGGHDIAR